MINSPVVMISASREPAAGGPASCGSSCEGMDDARMLGQRFVDMRAVI